MVELKISRVKIGLGKSWTVHAVVVVENLQVCLARSTARHAFLNSAVLERQSRRWRRGPCPTYYDGRGWGR